MSYGPQLPPHLQKKTPDTESDSEDDGQCYGPKLPSIPCRGPKPENEDESYGPKRGPQNIGPQIPSAAVQKPEEEASSDDEDMIGPMPPKPGEEEKISTAESIARSIEARAQKMKDKLEGKDQSAEPKRESWMLELPESKAKNFGLGPRSFSRSTNPKAKQDKSWTETPGSSTSKTEENDEKDHSQDEDVLAYMASLQRDAQMDKVTAELQKKRGSTSLLDMHSKELKKKKKEEGKGPAERRPFDRNVDLQVNRFDEAQKKAMIKKAANLDSRFSYGGSSKYL